MRVPLGILLVVAAAQALEHPYVAEYHDPEDEPTSEVPFSQDSEFDDLPHETLSEQIRGEILAFRNGA